MERNRFKRDLREAYRQHRHLLVPAKGHETNIVFLYQRTTAQQRRAFAETEQAMRELLLKLNSFLEA